MQAICYYRVSTAKQGRSGLGLEAQQQSVREFCALHSINIVSEFTEIETGKGVDAIARRPVLAAALAQAKRQNATLIVAKLDRLGRNVHFLSGLMSHQVPFCVASIGLNPTDFELHIRATLAQEEARLISERTKSALQQAKLRGVVLGNKTNLRDAGVKGNESMREVADMFALKMAPIIESLATSGSSYRQIAIRLNAMGTTTQRGKEWTAVQVSNIVKRLQANKRIGNC